MVYAIAAVVLFLTALASAAETALSRMSVSRAEELVSAQPELNRGLPQLLAQKPKYVNTLQLLIAIGWAGSTLMIHESVLTFPALESAGLVWTVLLAGIFGFLVLGVGATTLGRQHSDKILRTFGPLIRATATLLSPFVRLLILIGNAITPGRGMAEGPFASAAEMREMLDLVDESVIEDDERRMLHSVFELGDTVAREVMVPRTEMVFIERYKTLRQGISLALRSGNSRIPVIGEDIDDIVGVVYLKDISQRVFEHAASEQTEKVDSLMRPALFSPDSKRVDDLLREMQAARNHMAILIDEYGGTAGLVTIEDILEEIVGEISDEYDTADAEIVQLDEDRYRVSARLHIEDLAELIDIDLDADEEGIDTVAGLLSARLGRVAIPGATIQVEGWQLTAESAAGRRNKVSSVLVERIEGLSAAAE